MQATLEQEIQDRAKAAAEKLAVQKEEQRCRTEALDSQIRLEQDNHEAQLSAISAKHKEQVHIISWDVYITDWMATACCMACFEPCKSWLRLMILCVSPHAQFLCASACKQLSAGTLMVVLDAALTNPYHGTGWPHIVSLHMACR